MDARLHGEIGDEGVQEDVLAVEQLIQFGTDFRRLDVCVVLKNLKFYCMDKKDIERADLIL